MEKEKNSLKKASRREFLFAIGILAIPLLWWAWTFVYTTSDSIAMAFKEYDITTGKYVFCGFDTFGRTITELFDSGNVIGTSLINSVLLWLIQLCIAIPIAVIVSFALYKKVYGSGIFKVILFLPQIISSMVWVLAFRYILGLLGVDLNVDSSAATNTTKYVLLAYSLWLGFAGNMVMYTGAMSRIPPSLVEAGKLDGMTDIKEFWHIVLPLIFPTLSVILITCVMSIFTITLPVFSFFSQNKLVVDATQDTAKGVYTFGFYTFIKGLSNNTSVPQISVLSLFACMIAAPTTLGIRRLLNKIGPTVEY